MVWLHMATSSSEEHRAARMIMNLVASLRQVHNSSPNAMYWQDPQDSRFRMQCRLTRLRSGVGVGSASGKSRGNRDFWRSGARDGAAAVETLSSMNHAGRQAAERGDKAQTPGEGTEIKRGDHTEPEAPALQRTAAGVLPPHKSQATAERGKWSLFALMLPPQVNFLTDCPCPVPAGYRCRLTFPTPEQPRLTPWPPPTPRPSTPPTSSARTNRSVTDIALISMLPFPSSSIRQKPRNSSLVRFNPPRPICSFGAMNTAIITHALASGSPTGSSSSRNVWRGASRLRSLRPPSPLP